MALNDDATIIPGKGTIFLDAIGVDPPDYKTVNPNDASTHGTAICVGHTSRDNNISLSKEGGDVTVKGSWWAPNLRTSREAVNWGLTYNSLQVDRATLELAFGGGRVADGGYWVPDNTVAVVRSLLVLIVDGNRRAGFYFPKAELTLGDAPEISTDDFLEINIASSALSYNGDLFQILHPVFDAAGV